MSPILLTLFLCSPVDVIGLNSIASTFAVNYFKYRKAKFVCVFACEGDGWTLDFTKQASKLSLGVSSVKIDKTFEYKGPYTPDMCLQQELVSIGVLIDPTCDNFKRTMLYASKNTLMDTPRKWLIIYENDHLNVSKEDDIIYQNMLQTLENLNISINCDIVLAEKEDTGYQLHEIYNFGKIQGGDLIITRAGNWDHSKGFQTNLNIYQYYRRYNFQQWPMRLLSVMPPDPGLIDQTLKDPTPTPGVSPITKTAATILNVLTEIHNFRFEHSAADIWLDDFNLTNAKVVVISALHYRLVDISPVIRFFKEYYAYVDIVQPPLTSIETRYFYRIPTYGAGKFENQFLRPLSAGSWLCVVAVIGLCAVVLLLSAMLEQRPSSGQYAVFSALASICQQYFEDNIMETTVVSSARKLTILVTGISCVIIYNYYTSSVVSWLLNAPPPSINSLEELRDSPLELIFEDVGYTQSWLKTPTYYYNRRYAKVEDQLRRKVLNKRKDEPLFETLEDGIRMVKAGGYAYHTQVGIANRLISKTFSQSELCELGSLPSMEKASLFPCIQKNSPYKEFIVWSLQRLLERGIVRCIQHRTGFAPVRCEGSSPRALALGGAAPAFSLLAGGYILAIFILLLERKLSSSQHKKFSRKNVKIRFK